MAQTADTPVIRAYHLDRVGRLRPGMTLDHERCTPVRAGGILDVKLMMFLDARFPEGLTRFGADYLITRNFLTGTEDTSQETDVLFELVRRAEFPDRPSRYTSIFAAETLEDARTWRSSLEADDAPIYVVEAEESFRGDSEHLDLSGAVADVWMRACSYWQGESSGVPVWELLLAPPVRVLDLA